MSMAAGWIEKSCRSSSCSMEWARDFRLCDLLRDISDSGTTLVGRRGCAGGEVRIGWEKEGLLEGPRRFAWGEMRVPAVGFLMLTVRFLLETRGRGGLGQGEK